jgi:ABC-2 type transport system ATP-binding protein
MDTHKDSSRIRASIGYLPGEYGLYEDMTAVEYLHFLGSLRGDKDPPLKHRLVELLDVNTSRRIKSYSHGTKQKIALVQAFMHDPELVILDEPTSGLDPLVQQRFYEFILESKGRGRTILLSSHMLSEVERVCDRVAILKEGRLIALHGISDLKRLRLKTIEVTFEQDLEESVFQLEGVRKIEKDAHTVRLWIDGNINGILQVLSQHPVDRISCGDARLEDVFLEYYS